MTFEEFTEKDGDEVSGRRNGTFPLTTTVLKDGHGVSLERRYLEKAKSPEIVVDTVRLCDVVPETVAWLSKPRLPRGKLVIVEGAPDRGKTTLVLTIAAAVTRGWDALAGPLIADPADVVFVSSAEDGIADTIRPRVEAAGGDLARVQIIRSVGVHRNPLTMPDHLAVLRAQIERTGAALVIIDNLMAALAGKTNSYRDQDMRRTLSGLATITEETGACIIVIRHVTKSAVSTGGKAINAGGGSVGIGGAARVVLLCEEDPDNPGHYVLAIVKCNIAKWRHLPSLRYTLEDAPLFDCARLAWKGESTHTADDLTLRRTTPIRTGTIPYESRGALKEAVEWLSDVLTGGDVECGELQRLASQAGHAWRTIGRARQALNVTSTRIGFGRETKTVWRLPNSNEVSTRARQQLHGGNGTSRSPIADQVHALQGPSTCAKDTHANGGESTLARVDKAPDTTADARHGDRLADNA